MNFAQFFSTTTNRLLVACVLSYVLIEALFAGQRSGFELYYWHHPRFQHWQLISYLFLHGGLFHLALNMLALWSFGNQLERVWGGKYLLVFFLLCGIGAGVIHSLYGDFQVQQSINQLSELGYSQDQIDEAIHKGRYYSEQSKPVVANLYYRFHGVAVGASGAIYGILVAFALLFPNFKIILVFLPVPVAAKYLVPVLLAIDLTSGLTGVSLFGQNIAHFAHLGGALIGLLLVFLLPRSRSNN